MKLLLYVIFGIFTVAGLSLVGLSLASRKIPELGMHNGRLHPCPTTPNCVSSEIPGIPAFVEPLTFATKPDIAWQKAIRIIKETGGDIISEKPNYLHARYITRWLRFVDDVELRLDSPAHQIQIRSASRVGRSDLGKNRQRVKKIRAAWKSE